MALAIWVGVPHLIDGVVLSLERTLAEVEGHKLWGDVGDKGVAHGEDRIAPLVAGEEQVVAQGCLPLVVSCLHGVVGSTAFHPNELPMEVEVIGEPLSRLEGCVLGGTLSVKRHVKCKM